MHKTVAMLILLFVSLTACTSKETTSIQCPNGFCEKIFYGTDEVQWLNVFQAKSSVRTPVYVWAHPNGSSLSSPGSAYSFSEKVKNELVAAGISVISWESVPQVQTEADLAKTEADFKLMMSWLEKNADAYNIDRNKIVVGGRSRGTWASWPGANATGSIKGFYGVQAFPQNGWLVRDPRAYVTTQSPALFLTYDQPLNSVDNHKPEYGILVKEAYDSVGIGNKASLYYGLAESQLHDSLVVFVKRCTDTK